MTQFTYCYCGCKALVSDELSTFPFHNEEEKEKWALKHYGRPGEKQTNHSVEYMKNRLKEMGEEAKQDFAKSVSCQMRCGDGSGKKPDKHLLGCPYYSSGHSIDVNGNCNMGCC